MKYVQPLGVVDPNASYIDGNPDTGTKGSAVPAASIENPQREIVNLIAKAGLTPTGADLFQALKAVRSGAIIYGADFGTPGTVTATFDPALDAYTPGLTLHIKTAAACPGPSTFNTGTLGSKAIVNPNGAALKPNSWPTGAVIGIVYDGAAFQLVSVAAASEKLFANVIYYVNAGIGSDTLYDGAAATISGSHGPFATVQRAITEAQKFNQNGYSVTINVALGTYPPFTCSTINGSGAIVIVGDKVTPSNVMIHAVTGEAIVVNAPGYFLAGMKVQADAPGSTPHAGAGLRMDAAVSVSDFEFGSCASAHILAEGSGSATFTGTASGNPTDFYNVSGDSPYHIQCVGGANVNNAAPVLNIIGARNIGIWASCSGGSFIAAVYSTINLGGGVTGKKFDINLNGVVSVLGAGINYLPGTVAGTTATGGQYG